VNPAAPANATQPPTDRPAAEPDLDAYAAQAAHQLGEAVALLRGYLVVLEQRGEQDLELADALRGLGAGTSRAQRFVDDLLDLAAAGRAEPASEAVALDAALQSARERLADDLEDAGAEIRAPASPPAARADRELVVRLLAHLLRVALSAGARTIELAADREGDRVSVTVRDDGTPAVGEPFVAFAKARGRGPLVGAGVGLVVARRIVERHGGAIALHEDDAGATVVTFTLPADA
jgi:light-regulated signal transduction histidine kinase (bacteriophytochrome)